MKKERTILRCNKEQNAKKKIVENISAYCENKMYCYTMKDLIIFNKVTHKIVDIKPSEVPSYVSLKLLIKKIKQSRFLSGAKNFSLSICVKHYDKIVKGFYDNDYINKKYGDKQKKCCKTSDDGLYVKFITQMKRVDKLEKTFISLKEGCYASCDRHD